MKIERFEDIIAWQKGKELSLQIYKLFKDCRDFGFKDQIQRAVISICNNIAEGFERKSNKEFKQYLFIAKGSCGELRSMLHIALGLKYLSRDEYSNALVLSEDISKLLSGFIKKL
jgi:four helix bundle protein